MGHALEEMEKAYLRKHPPEPRRDLMEEWAIYLGLSSPLTNTPLVPLLPPYLRPTPQRRRKHHITRLGRRPERCVMLPDEEDHG